MGEGREQGNSRSPDYLLLNLKAGRARWFAESESQRVLARMNENLTLLQKGTLTSTWNEK